MGSASVEFLGAIPYFASSFGEYQGSGVFSLPTLASLNELLKSCAVDAGMSGACSWKPFEIERSE